MGLERENAERAKRAVSTESAETDENAEKDEGEARRRKSGAATKSRTRDLLITSQLLYHG